MSFLSDRLFSRRACAGLAATVLALGLPGAGQIYNGMAKEGSFFRKYWKVPVVWAGVGTCVAFIDLCRPVCSPSLFPFARSCSGLFYF